MRDFYLRLPDFLAQVAVFKMGAADLYYDNFKDLCQDFFHFMKIKPFQQSEMAKVLVKSFLSQEYFRDNSYGFDEQLSRLRLMSAPRDGAKATYLQTNSSEERKSERKKMVAESLGKLRVKSLHESDLQLLTQKMETQLRAMGREGEKTGVRFGKFFLRQIEKHSRHLLTYDQLLAAALRNFRLIKTSGQLRKFTLLASLPQNTLRLHYLQTSSDTSPLLNTLVHNLFTSKMRLREALHNRSLLNFSIDSVSPRNQEHKRVVGEALLSCLLLKNVAAEERQIAKFEETFEREEGMGERTSGASWSKWRLKPLALMEKASVQFLNLKSGSQIEDSLGQIETPLLQKLALRKVESQLKQKLLFHYLMLKPLTGERLQVPALNRLSKTRLKEQRRAQQKVTLVLQRLGPEDESGTNSPYFLSGRLRLKKFHQLQNLYFRAHPEVARDFARIRAQDSLGVIKLNDKSEAKRISGKNDNFELFADLILQGHEKIEFNKDLGSMRLSPVPYHDEGFLVCCRCGCFAQANGCCQKETQNNAAFTEEATTVINLRPQVTVNLFTQIGSSLSRPLQLRFDSEGVLRPSGRGASGEVSRAVAQQLKESEQINTLQRLPSYVSEILNSELREEKDQLNLENFSHLDLQMPSHYPTPQSYDQRLFKERVHRKKKSKEENRALREKKWEYRID